MMKTLLLTIVFVVIVALAVLELAAVRVEPATAPLGDVRESPF